MAEETLAGAEKGITPICGFLPLVAERRPRPNRRLEADAQRDAPGSSASRSA
jgi:hypothetical protein